MAQTGGAEARMVENPRIRSGGMQAGYTLLEMVVSVAAFALMAVPLTDALRAGLRLAEREFSAHMENDAAFVLRRQLRAWFAEAAMVNPNRPADSPVPPMRGQGDWVEFVGALNPDPVFDSLYLARLEVAESGDLRFGIMDDHRAVTSYDPDGFDWTVVMSDVDSITFRYLTIDADTGPVWRDDWQLQSYLPAAIRVSVQGRNDESPFEVTVPLISGGWAHCAFDMVAKDCRAA